MKRVLAIIASTVTLVLSLGSIPTFASQGDTYLALGDSVAFGFSPLLDKNEADNFVGYPESLARMLDLDVTNASCPGEASGGFISLTGVDNVCRPYRAQFPLHVDYTTSQLDFAVRFLRDHRDTKLVTLNIGANDLFVLQKSCEPAPNPTACTIAGLPGLLITLSSNLTTIYTRIRATGYRGQLIALTYYAVNYSDATGVAVITGLNQAIATVTTAPGIGGEVVDGFEAWRGVAAGFGGDSCAAGLLIRLTPTKCDIHPSPAGRDLLAGAIRAVVRLPVEVN